jgi:hypothetical protein
MTSHLQKKKRKKKEVNFTTTPTTLASPIYCTQTFYRHNKSTEYYDDIEVSLSVANFKIRTSGSHSIFRHIKHSDF